MQRLVQGGGWQPWSPAWLWDPSWAAAVLGHSAPAHFSNARVNACFDHKKRQCLLNLGVVRVLLSNAGCVCILVLLQDN